MTNAFRGITDTGDWQFGNGKNSYFTDVYSKTNNPIKADIETTLKTFLTECFFNQNVGVPWFQLLNGKDTNALILTIKKAIYNIDGVTQVLELQFDLDINRNATIQYVVDTLYTTQIMGTVTL
jgi:hypothetical protein